MSVPGSGRAAANPRWAGPTAAAGDQAAPLRRTGPAQGATFLELFFDLMHVFALTHETRRPTPPGPTPPLLSPVIKRFTSSSIINMTQTS
ncbi:hypothetical protein ACQP1S_21635 [Micromonospora matsumotoense]|uniref:hypothetical protein n=1 Tax=Micromonospora matsumotoense TaxID=121616 RepID=UPI003D903BB5